MELTFVSKLELMGTLCVIDEANVRRLVYEVELCEGPTKCHAFARAYGGLTALHDAIDHAAQK